MTTLRARTQRRRPRSATLALGLAVAALGAALLAACGGSSSAPIAQVTQVGGPSQVSPEYPGAIVLPTTYAMPDVTLTDTAGQPYDLAAETKGKVTLLYFGYTHCPDVCPINMALAAKAVSLLDSKQRAQVDVVFVTTDPDRDTPPVIRTWLDAFSPSFIGLTGTIAQIHSAESSLGMPLSIVMPAETPSAGAYEVEHAGYVLGYDRSGRAKLQFDDSETASNYATSLRHLLSA